MSYAPWCVTDENRILDGFISLAHTIKATLTVNNNDTCVRPSPMAKVKLQCSCI